MDDPTTTDALLRIADASERIARALEHQIFGVGLEDVRATAALLAEDLNRQRAARAAATE